MKLTSKELKQIKGGAGVSGTLVSGIVKGVGTFLDLGRSLGSAIRRLANGTICPI